MNRIRPTASVLRLVGCLAAAAPVLIAAAPAPSGTALPVGTFALATVARIVTVPGTGDTSPRGYTAAPTPNGSLSAPLPIDSDSRSPELAPGLFRPKKTYGGEGYIQGSTIQDQQQRKISPAAGIALKVPLD